MITIGILLIILAGIAEHFKDLSEEGKLSGYWDKNHKPKYYHWGLEQFRFFGYDDGIIVNLSKETTEKYLKLWWDVHWLQGDLWDKIPVWIRQYLAFRDGWHLLKFFSLNLFAVGIVVLFSVNWWWFFILRFAFSLPETIFRKYLK